MMELIMELWMQHSLALPLMVVFDWMRQQPWCRPRLDSYSLAVQIAAHSRMWGRSEALFEEMQADGVRPDSFVFSAMVRVLAQQGRWEDAIGLVERRAAADVPELMSLVKVLLHDMACSPHAASLTAALLSSLSSLPSSSSPSSSASSSPNPFSLDHESYRLLLRSFYSHNHLPLIPPTVTSMIQAGYPLSQWDAAMWLEALAAQGDVAGIRAAVAESLALGLPEPESFRMALVLGFARAGEMDRAWIVFVGKEESERVSEGVSEGVSEEVQEGVSEGVQEGVASQVSQKQPKRGVEPSLYVMVVEAMVGAGRMEQAEAVCAEYGRAHLVTVQRFKYGRPYTVLLSAYLLAGNLSAFSRVWTAMRAGGRPADSYALRLLAKACASMGGLRGLAVMLWAAKEEREREVGGSEGESEGGNEGGSVGGSEEVDSPTWEAVGASGGASVAVPEGSVTDEPCASSAAVAAGASAAAPLAELAAGAMVVEVPPEEVEAAERQFPVLAGELRGSDKALRVVVRYLFKDADVAGGDDIVPADVAAGDDVVPADVAASGEKVDGGMAEGDGHGVVEAGSGWSEECVGVPAAAEEAVSVPAAGQQHVCGGRGEEASEGDHAGESDWDVLGQSVCASDGMVEGVEGAEAVFKSTQKQTRGVLGQSVPVVGGKVEAGTVQHGGSWRDENQLGAVHMAVAEMAVAEAAVAEAAVAETAVAETAVAETAVAETAVAEMAVAERAVEAAVAEASPEGDFPEEMVAQAAGGEAEAVDDAITKVIAAEAGGNEAAAAAGSDAAPEEMVAKAVGGVAEVVDGSTSKVTAEEPVGNEVAGTDSHAVEGDAHRVGNRVGDRLGQRFGNRFGRDRFGDRFGNDRVGDYVQSTYWGVVWNPESGAEGGDARAGGTGRRGGRVGGRERARVGERVRSALEELERAEEGELAERWAQLAQGEGERAGERGGERGGARGRRQGAAQRVEQTWELMGERRARLRGDRERLSPVMGGGRGVRGEGNEGADEAGMGEWEQEGERDGEGRGSEVVWKRVDPEEAWLLVQQQMADPAAPPPPPAAWARVFSALRDPGQYGQLKEVYRMMLSAVGREGTQMHGQQGQEGQEEGQMRRQQGQEGQEGQEESQMPVQEGQEGQEESQMPVQEGQEELRWVQQGREEMQVGRSMSRYAGTADGGVDSKRSETQEGDSRGRGSGRVDSSGSDSNEGDSNESATVFTGGYVLPFNLVLMSACRQEAADDVAAVFGDMLSHNVIPSWGACGPNQPFPSPTSLIAFVASKTFPPFPSSPSPHSLPLQRSLLFVLKGACGPNQPFPSPATLVAFVASKATQLPPEPHASEEPATAGAVTSDTVTSDRVTSAAAPCASSALSAHASSALSTRAREVLENMAVLLIGEPWAVDRLRWSVEIAECMQRAQGSSPLLLPSPLARRFFFASRSLRLVGKERDEEGRGEAEKRDEGRGREEVEEMEYVGKGREQGGGEKGSEGRRGGVEGEQDEEAEEGLDGRGVGLGASERRELLKQQLIGVVRPDERREEEKWEGGSVAVLGSAEAREELADRMEALLEASAAARQAAWEEKTARRAAEQAEWAAKQLRVEAEWREERERERGVAVERWRLLKGNEKGGLWRVKGGGGGGFGGDEEGRVRGMVRGGLGEGPEEGRWGAETRGDRMEEEEEVEEGEAEGAAGKGVAVGATGVGATDLGEQEQGVGEQREQRRQREEREEREAFAVGVAEQVRMLEFSWVKIRARLNEQLDQVGDV
ncbi:unnamed protein product [Closterium sp. Naga37s-1]|nr:unnamed protein product [Closterium sp. Naga37s-1]